VFAAPSPLKSDSQMRQWVSLSKFVIASGAQGFAQSRIDGDVDAGILAGPGDGARIVGQVRTTVMPARHAFLRTSRASLSHPVLPAGYCRRLSRLPYPAVIALSRQGIPQ
jgi:hypothetical protein